MSGVDIPVPGSETCHSHPSTPEFSPVLKAARIHLVGKSNSKMESKILAMTSSVNTSKQFKQQSPVDGDKQHQFPWSGEQRSAESIRLSRMAEVTDLESRGRAKRWNRQEANATGALYLTGRWVDDPTKEKSRYTVREFAKHKNASVASPTPHVVADAVIEHKALRDGVPMFVFDVRSAFRTSIEDEPVFIEPPPEVLEEEDCVWQSVYRLYGRRTAARGGQDHLCEVMTCSECPMEVERCPQVPTMYFAKKQNVTVCIHVDDGNEMVVVQNNVSMYLCSMCHPNLILNFQELLLQAALMSTCEPKRFYWMVC